MLSKRLAFALIILIMAISAVSAGDLNTTADAYSYDDSSGAILQNCSDVLVSESIEDSGFGEIDSDALAAGQTVYFDASANADGTGTKSSPYKYLTSDRITSGMTAYFADGVYGYSGSKDILSKTTFIGQSRANTIIKGESYTFSLTVSSDSNLILKDLTFDNGRVVNNGDMEADNVIFKNSIRQNSPTSSVSASYIYGGAIYSWNSTKGRICNLNLRNCYFEEGNAKYGGAVAAEYSNVIISDCTFYDSQSIKFGGAVYSVNSDLTISRSSFNKNYARYGGTLYCELSNIKLTDSNFTDSSSYSFGGVIACQHTDLTSANCVYSDYKSSNDAGGAIYFDGSRYDGGKIISSKLLNVTKSSFRNGQAYWGGAVCVLNAIMQVSDSVFRNNTAVYYGGSVFIVWSRDSNITSSKFIDSSAETGGAVYSMIMASRSSMYPHNLYLTSNVFENSNAKRGKLVYCYDNVDSIVAYNNTCKGGFYYDFYSGINDNVVSSETVPVIYYVPDSSGSIPSSYDSRDYGYITVAKDQQQGGNCWAFAAISTLEACLKKATGITYDLSEENIKNLMAEFSIYGLLKLPNKGGDDDMVFSYFANWFGPVEEYVDEYDDRSTLSVLFYPIINVQNIYSIPSSDTNAIKRAIMDYGAVAASYDNFGGDDAHAITVIGWDDNYNAKDYFGTYTKGAWIIKNSWGADWKDGGCTYISYDKKFKTALYTFVFDDAEAYAKSYQYDTGDFSYRSVSGQAGYKNIFTASSDEYLSAFSTYFKIPTNYSVSVYVGDTLKLTQSGHSLAGYYTIPFNTKIRLSKGNQFTIVVTLQNAGYNHIPLSAAINVIPFAQGVSYVDKGSGWVSTYTGTGFTEVACIKAFTTPLTLNEVTLSVDKPGTVYADEEVTFTFKLSDAQLSRGLVAVVINDKTYYACVYNGKATLNISFKDLGSHALTAYYKTNFHTSNTVSFTFNVVKKSENIVISAPDLTKYYGSSSQFSIRVTSNGNPVSGASVKFTQGTTSQTVTTNSNGYAYVSISWAVGTYDVTSQYGGVSASSKVTVKSTVSVSDLSYDYGNSCFKASFYDTAGNALSNTQVKFKVGSTVYNAVANSNGASIYLVRLDADTYTVTAVNPVSGEEKSFKLTVRKTTPTISLATAQSGSSVTFTAILNPSAATGNVKFTVGSTLSNYTRSISDGKATLTLTLNSGSYNVYATYLGDGNCYSVKSSTTTVTVSASSNIVLTASELTKYYGSTAKYSVRVTDNGQPLAGAGVKFTLGTTTRTVSTNSNGYAYLDINLAPGSYPVKSEHGGKSITSKVTVKSTLSVSDLTYDYGSSYLKATFYNTAGNALSNTDVKFKVGSTVYTTTTNSNGAATYSIVLGAGSYDVTAVNPASGEEKSFNLTVSKVTPALTLKEVKIDGKTAVRATLSKTSATGNIVFTFENKEYPTGISKGVSNFIINKDSGTYKVKVKYSGDANFNTVSKSITVEINTYSTTISVKDLTKVYGDSKKLTITVRDNNGKLVSNDMVTVDVYDSKLNYYDTYWLYTNSKGQAKLSCNFKPGEYSIDIEDDYDYVFAEVVVKKAASKLAASNRVVSVKAKVKVYVVTLKNNKNMVMKNKKVTLRVGGVTYVTKTNGYGKATFKVTKLNRKGTYNAIVSFAGNSYYKKVTKVVRFYVR